MHVNWTWAFCDLFFSYKKEICFHINKRPEPSLNILKDN